MARDGVRTWVLDWPLSQSEKRGRVLELYAKELEAAYTPDEDEDEADAVEFCKAWDTATSGKQWSDCSLTFDPTGDDYIAWKISSPTSNITDEFIPKDKTRYGWRAWTSLWQPAPVESRTCDTVLYGVKVFIGLMIRYRLHDATYGFRGDDSASDLEMALLNVV